MRELENGDVVLIRVSDRIIENYSNIKKKDEVFFRVSLIDEDIVYGTFKKGDNFFKGKIKKDEIKEIDDSKVWKNL